MQNLQEVLRRSGLECIKVGNYLCDAIGADCPTTLLPVSVRSRLDQATRKFILHNLTKQAVKAALPLRKGFSGVKILLYLILQKNTRGEHVMNNKFLLLGMVIAFLLSFTDIGITATVDSSGLRTAATLENIAFLRNSEQTSIADQ